MGLLTPLKDMLVDKNPLADAMEDAKFMDDVDNEIAMENKIYKKESTIDPKLDEDLGEDEDDWDGTFMNDNDDVEDILSDEEVDEDDFDDDEED